MTLFELRNNDVITYFFIQIHKLDILKSEFGYIAETNAKAIFEHYRKEIKIHSLETGDFEYAEMFTTKNIKSTQC
jgi:hypothetical protein